MTFYKKVKVSEEYFSSTTKRALTFLCKRVNGPDIVHFLALFCLNINVLCPLTPSVEKVICFFLMCKCRNGFKKVKNYEGENRHGFYLI